ncbi:hypothetical protein AB9K35_17455 [Leisingera sp. XS_AS12]|uniref:hypothetical protein n=1 Tax=Leisingera sp. XS_AS12 TaxID=3241294 RepID=UPI003515925C
MPLNTDILRDAITHRRAWLDGLIAFAKTHPHRAADIEAASGALNSAPSGPSEADAVSAAAGVEHALPVIREALEAQIAQAEQEWDGDDSNDGGYWKHELRALNGLASEINKNSVSDTSLEFAL